MKISQARILRANKTTQQQGQKPGGAKPVPPKNDGKPVSQTNPQGVSVDARTGATRRNVSSRYTSRIGEGLTAITGGIHGADVEGTHQIAGQKPEFSLLAMLTFYNKEGVPWKEEGKGWVIGATGQDKGYLMTLAGRVLTIEKIE